MNADNKKDSEQDPRVIKVIVETPQGSKNKYAWNEKLKIIELKDNLPLGLHFPYDFGFIPETMGGDGDPLDIFILSDMPAEAGSMIPCRIIGAIKAEQQEQDGKIVENHRVIAVSTQCASLCELHSIRNFNEDLIKQLIAFLIFYEKQLGKKFMPKSIIKPGAAMELINSSIEDKEIKDINQTKFQLKAQK